VQDVLQHEMIEIVFMGRQEDDGMSLFEGCDALHTFGVIDEFFVIAPRIEPPDQADHEIDHERAMRRRDFFQIAQRLGRERLDGGIALAFGALLTDKAC
jgi:hypothetical protein